MQELTREENLRSKRLRKGELCGLRGSDVHLNAGLISVTSPIQRWLGRSASKRWSAGWR